ncbi:MAG: DUF4956 domain-containing protein [Chthoniobacteraceae bacterium]
MTNPTAFFPTILGLATDTDPERLGPVLRMLHHSSALRPLADFFEGPLGFGSAQPGLIEILFATFLSFGLTAIIAALYKSIFRGPKLSQDYVHTLMILGVVVTVVVMVVRAGDRDQAMATGFGMFAAFSLIRFRTSLAEARDIGFIFFAMTAGLAVGARQYGMATATTVVICAIIGIFSRGDWFAPNRASHYLRVRVTNDIDYDVAFAEVFGRFVERHDLVSVESIQAGMMTELRYNISLRPGCRAGEFVSAIQQINGNNRVLLTSAAPNRTLGTE